MKPLPLLAGAALAFVACATPRHEKVVTSPAPTTTVVHHDRVVRRLPPPPPPPGPTAAELAAQERARQAEAARLAERQARLEAEQNAARANALSEQERLANAQLAAEKADAERRALEQVASVREEQRGLVLTMNGTVLFGFNESTLLPAAKQKLDVVAGVLRESPRATPVVIEGHTDAAGTDAYNLGLSQRRAEAVRAYLVAQGVDPSRAVAVGAGESNPIASNDDAGGRASNRRVEIVIPRAAQGIGGSGSDGK